jgi:hypothetical protein
MDVRYILWLLDVCIFSAFGTLHQEKSGNRGAKLTNDFLIYSYHASVVVG